MGLSSPNLDSVSSEPRRTKGQASRETILLAAARLATLKGLSGLSIGDLAAEVGMSKSGLYAHFDSKEALELATIDMAVDIFQREVLDLALPAPAGTTRLRALVDAFLHHLERRVFPGGCFFAAVATELDTRPGPARDRVIEIQEMWIDLLGQCYVDAQANGEVDPNLDVPQIVFESAAMLMAANYMFVMKGDPIILARSRTGIENIIARASRAAGSHR